MARVCEVTGKGPMVGNNVSHAKLESTAGTGHFYTTSKNKKTMPEKMLIKKFDPKARKHVDYKEMKLK